MSDTHGTVDAVAIIASHYGAPAHIAKLMITLDRLGAGPDLCDALAAAAMCGIPPAGIERVARQWASGRAIYLPEETPGAPEVDGVYRLPVTSRTTTQER